MIIIDELLQFNEDLKKTSSRDERVQILQNFFSSQSDFQISNLPKIIELIRTRQLSSRQSYSYPFTRFVAMFCILSMLFIDIRIALFHSQGSAHITAVVIAIALIILLIFMIALPKLINRENQYDTLISTLEDFI